MALSQVYTAVVGHVITAARWNNEFGNIYSNGTDLAFPLTKTVSLNGFSLTLDSAGATTITSSASQGLAFSPGAKSGTPGINGSFFNEAAATFTDTNTSNGGTAAFWSANSFRRPTLAAQNTTVTTTDAATVYIEGTPIAGTNETLTNPHALLCDGQVRVRGDVQVQASDSRTTTVDRPFQVQSTTTGTAAAGIGVGIEFKAESAGEAESEAGQLDFIFSAIGSGPTTTQQTYTSIKQRNAGSLSEAYTLKRVASGFNAEISHSNSANRSYEFPNRDLTLGAGDLYMGPSSVGSGSGISHEGSVTISGNQNLSGIHCYTNFTLNSGVTLTLPDNSHRLVIYASGTITINGTIDGVGAGAAGGAAATIGLEGATNSGGGSGNSGGAGGLAGGDVYIHSVLWAAGGTANGGAGVSVTGQSLLLDPFSVLGGAGGSGGTAPSTGGNGGGTIVLMGASVVLGSTATLNTSGNPGVAGGVGRGGGGGGGAGNVYIFCRTYTDNGATFTMNGGAGGGADAGSVAGGAGGNGSKQINIYA